MLSINFLISFVGLGAITAAYPVLPTTQQALPAVNGLGAHSRVDLLQGNGGHASAVANSHLNVEDLANNSGTVDAYNLSGLSNESLHEVMDSGDSILARRVIQPRMYYLIIPKDGHLSAGWIAATVILSILVVGAIVGAVAYCYLHSKHFKRTRQVAEDRANLAARVAKDLAGSTIFEKKHAKDVPQGDVESQDASASTANTERV